MNRPDEKTLSSWLDGELEGEELRKIEAWAETNAGDLDAEFKCKIGWDALNDEKLASMPASEEPPYPEFFNSKLKQAIMSDGEAEVPLSSGAESRSLWQKVRHMMAPAAVAAMVAFYAGTKMGGSDAAVGSDMVVEDIGVYVPDGGIVAAVSESDDGSTEIILDGLTPISDELDIVAGETSPGQSPMMVNMEEGLSSFIFF